jgi:hypothetical protein
VLTRQAYNTQNLRARDPLCYPKKSRQPRTVGPLGVRAPENKENFMAKQASAKAEPSVGKTRKRSVSKTATQGAPAAVEPLSPAALSHEQIAQYAYEIYLARGASEGGAVHDWLQAEHELRARVG